MNNNTNYQPIIVLAYRLNATLARVSEDRNLIADERQLDAVTTGSQFVERLAWINNRMMTNGHEGWRDMSIIIPDDQLVDGDLPGWSDVRGLIVLTGKTGQVYELDVTVQGEGRAVLNAITVDVDHVFPRNGKRVLQAKQGRHGFVLKFYPKATQGDTPKGERLHELSHLMEQFNTLANFDEPSRDLLDLINTALRPY